MPTRHRLILLLICFVIAAPNAIADDRELAQRADKALHKAVDFFRTKVAAHGSYVWRYSADLKLREGEGKATATTAWVQPPGTPSVGLAFLRAYAATKERYYLQAARETGMALVKGQLRSGGWDYRIEFGAERRRYAYRVEPNNPRGRNVTTLDDNNTQQAVRFLMRLDQTLQFKDKTIHEAVTFALQSLLKAQYPNGAWPQRFDAFPDPNKHPVRKASYPAKWSRTYPGKNYRGYYTLNDNTLADMIDTMDEAGRIYKDDRYRQAALRGGDFLLLAQMPEPQPAWAQQYDFDMHPAWARRFEPPAITGGESQGVMRILLKLYVRTGHKKYLTPLPKAIAFFRRVKLPGNRLARFYELRTSKPLYFTKTYKLTYNDNDLPTHYGFKVSNGIEAIAREYERVRKLPPTKTQPKSRPPRVTSGLRRRVEQVIRDLDEQGRWLEDDVLRTQDRGKKRRIISCRTFIRNIETFSDFLEVVAASNN